MTAENLTAESKSDVITIRIPKKALLIVAGIATLGVSALVVKKVLDGADASDIVESIAVPGTDES